MTIDDILKQFDEEFPVISCVTPQHAFVSDSIIVKAEDLRTFLRSSYSELLGEVEKEIHDLYTPIHQGLPTVFKDEVISIIKSKLPKEDSIN